MLRVLSSTDSKDGFRFAGLMVQQGVIGLVQKDMVDSCVCFTRKRLGVADLASHSADDPRCVAAC